MTRTRQVCWVVAIAVLGGVCAGLTSGVLHEAISYGIAIGTGALLGLGMAKR